MIINVLEYLDESAAKYSNKIAFTDHENQVTYSQLRKHAQAIGSKLIKLSNGKHNTPVAILVDRHIQSIISFFGVLYSGNFYVPINKNMPIERIKKIFGKINPGIVITFDNETELLQDLNYEGQIADYQEAISTKIEEDKIKKTLRNLIDTDPLYAVFTSGSTGTPKGVLINHKSIIDLIEQFTKIFGFSNDSVFGNQAPLDYDGSVKDIYSTIKNGATMHIIPRSNFSFPINLFEYLETRKINTIIWATSALRIIANLKALEKKKPAYLDKILFTGEVMPNKVLNYFRRHYPNAFFVNLYGPTEITCNCSYFIVDRPFKDDDVLPIGIPFRNTDIFILNQQNQRVAENDVGEICVRGTSLALGYYNDSVETEKVFCNNPLNPFYPERIYRTGDLGKYNSKGELLFISRIDSQIKHMGYRVELGEIEVAANSIGSIDSAFCKYDVENDQIVLFYQSPEKDDKKILVALRQKLPRFMIPNKLFHYIKFPLKNNLKIDRVKIWKESINKSYG